jgi:hypothetical protein
VPRLLQLLALVVALAIAGVPTWIGELLEDDCAQTCAGDQSAGGCQEQGCTDCSVVCSSCARGLHGPPVASVHLAAAILASVDAAIDVPQRVPIGPPPQGIFHPPRAG